MPRRKNKSYSTGELNKLIDSVVHPLTRRDPEFWVVDTFLHGLVEQDPPLSARKFLKYTVPKLIQQQAAEAKRKTRKRH